MDILGAVSHIPYFAVIVTLATENLMLALLTLLPAKRSRGTAGLNVIIQIHNRIPLFLFSPVILPSYPSYLLNFETTI